MQQGIKLEEIRWYWVSVPTDNKCIKVDVYVNAIEYFSMEYPILDIWEQTEKWLIIFKWADIIYFSLHN